MGWTPSSENQIGSKSSRTDREVTTYDTDADHIDFGVAEEIKSYEALTDHNTKQFSIKLSESEEALVEETTDLATVHYRSIVVKGSKLADKFILARETVVHFVQESIADAVDRQKRNADKNGRANVLLFDESDLFLLSAVNIVRHMVTNVGSNLLLPRFIGRFRVLHRLLISH